MKTFKQAFRAILVSLGMAALFAIQGCAYHLGATLPADCRNVRIVTHNTTDEPALDRTLAPAFFAEIQRDGTMRVADAQSATATLEITATAIRLTPISYDKNDSLIPNEYRVQVTAAYKLTRISDKKVISSGSETGDTDFPISSEFAADKVRNLPAVCTDLSRRIVRRCVFVF